MLLMIVDGSGHYVIRDHLFSPVALVSGRGGAIVERYEYDVYGQPTIYTDGGDDD